MVHYANISSQIITKACIYNVILWWGWPAAALKHPPDPSPPTYVQQMGFRGKKPQTWQNLPYLPHTDARAPPINTVRHRSQHDVDPPQFRSSIFRYPPTSIFRVLINRPTCCSAFLFTWPYHLSLASYIFSPMCATPVLLLFRHSWTPKFASSIWIVSSKFCSFLRAQVPLPYIGSSLMTVLLHFCFVQCRHI